MLEPGNNGSMWHFFLCVKDKNAKAVRREACKTFPVLERKGDRQPLAGGGKYNPLCWNVGKRADVFRRLKSDRQQKTFLVFVSDILHYAGGLMRSAHLIPYPEEPDG